MFNAHVNQILINYDIKYLDALKRKDLLESMTWLDLSSQFLDTPEYD